MPFFGVGLILLALTGSSFFVLGAYYQHHDFWHKLQQLIQQDPYAFYIREKLYDAVGHHFTLTHTFAYVLKNFTNTLLAAATFKS